MSISGVSSYGPVAPNNGPRADFQQLRDGFKGIDSALQSGDLDSAKKALDQFKQAMQDLQSRKGDKPQSDQESAVADDVNALDQAVQSGDTEAAKKAFETLTKDMQSLRHARGGHHHHKSNAGGDQGATSSTEVIAVSVSTTTTTGTNGTNGSGPVDFSV